MTDAASRAWAGFSIALLLLLTGCADPVLPEHEATFDERQPIVYGDDDREDVFSHPDAALAELVRTSVVALIPKELVSIAGPDAVELTTSSFQEAYGLCAEERFAEQPSVASCSGVLIDDDLVLTAAHCLREGFGDSLGCDQYAFVFDYFLAEEDRLETITPEEVFGCRKIEFGTAESGSAPAIVRLDRSVGVGRVPVGYGDIPGSGDPVAVLGFPSGLPAKIDTGAHVLESVPPTEDGFALDSDTSGSSSGSGIFNAERELVGILVAGSDDFEMTEDGCLKTRRVPQGDETYYERAASVQELRDGIDDLVAGAAGQTSAPAGGNERSTGGCTLTSQNDAKAHTPFGVLFLAILVRRARRDRRTSTR